MSNTNPPFKMNLLAIPIEWKPYIEVAADIWVSAFSGGGSVWLISLIAAIWVFLYYVLLCPSPCCSVSIGPRASNMIGGKWNMSSWWLAGIYRHKNGWILDRLMFKFRDTSKINFQGNILVNTLYPSSERRSIVLVLLLLLLCHAQFTPPGFWNIVEWRHWTVLIF